MSDSPAISGIADYSRIRLKVYRGSGQPDGNVPAEALRAGLQPSSALLVALAALNDTPGLLVQTGATTFAKRTLTGTANQITVVDGNGVSGNPTLSLPVGILQNGTYTPTLTGVTNIQASTAYVCRWQRVGSFVTVSGQVDIDPTAAAPTASQIDISLPIASTLASTSDCTGVATQRLNSPGTILGITANNRAGLFFVAESASNNQWAFVFTYVII